MAFCIFFDSIDSIFISIRSMLRPSVVVDRLGDGKPDMNCIGNCVMAAGKCKRNCDGDKQCVKSCDDEENRCMFPKCLSSSMLQLQETSDQGGLRSIRSIRKVFDMFDRSNRFDNRKNRKIQNATFGRI